MPRQSKASRTEDLSGPSPVLARYRRGIWHDGVIRRAETIASYGVKVEIIRVVYGFSGVTVILHNTGNRDSRVLDEHVVAVFAFRGDKISCLDTYLSDVAMAEVFFG
jgi:hypothetical protein